MNYRIYANGIKGWELIKTTYNVDEINIIIDNLTNEYTRYIVIQHDMENNQDIPYMRGELERNVRCRNEERKI